VGIERMIELTIIIAAVAVFVVTVWLLEADR
jgi:hypothetical protein